MIAYNLETKNTLYQNNALKLMINCPKSQENDFFLCLSILAKGI